MQVPGQTHSFVQHIQLGVEQAAADPTALLLFSGGKTRRCGHSDMCVLHLTGAHWKAWGLVIATQLECGSCDTTRAGLAGALTFDNQVPGHT